jgi:hypothetical protein
MEKYPEELSFMIDWEPAEHLLQTLKKERDGRAL